MFVSVKGVLKIQLKNFMYDRYNFSLFKVLFKIYFSFLLCEDFLKIKAHTQTFIYVAHYTKDMLPFQHMKIIFDTLYFYNKY